MLLTLGEISKHLVHTPERMNLAMGGLPTDTQSVGQDGSDSNNPWAWAWWHRFSSTLHSMHSDLQVQLQACCLVEIVDFAQ